MHLENPQENWRGQQLCRIHDITKIQEINRWNFIPLGRSLCLDGGLSFISKRGPPGHWCWDQAHWSIYKTSPDENAERKKKFSEVQGRISGSQYEKIGESFVLTGTPNGERECAKCLPGVNKSAHYKKIWSYEADPFPWVWDFDCRKHPHWGMSLAAYGWDELGVLISFFSSVLTEEEQTAIPHEWSAFIASVKARKRTKTAHEILSDLLGSNTDDICNLLILVRIMVTLSPSSASVERGFSQMKALKSARGSRMHNNTLSA